MPDAAELQLVWPHNMQLGRAKNGNVIRLEAWGAANVAEIQSRWAPSDRIKTAWLFLEELQNLMLVEISHRERELCQISMLVDAGGMSTAHRALSAHCLREVRVCMQYTLMSAYDYILLTLTCIAFVARSAASCEPRSTLGWSPRSSWLTSPMAARCDWCFATWGCLDRRCL